MKKLKVFEMSFVVIFIIFIFFLFRATDYTTEYIIDGVDITETYSKENKYYYFTLTYEGTTFDYLLEESYQQKREFIKSIDIITVDEDFCLLPQGEDLEFIPLCLQDGDIIHYSLVRDDLASELPEEYQIVEATESQEYEEINIYNTDYTYLLWDYNGFYFINSDEQKKLTLFDQEIYNATLITYTKDYLIVADYDADYTFQSFYRLSLTNGSVKKFSLDYEIYFDSYFPGYVKNKLYIVDNKEEVMYEWNAKNGDLDKISSQLLIDDEWESVGIKSLINQNKTFTYKTNYNYTLSDGMLYLTYTPADIKIAIADDVTSIIRIKDNLVFYLKTDTLYVFDPLEGSQKLLSYFEWNFNNSNMIYVN